MHPRKLSYFSLPYMYYTLPYLSVSAILDVISIRLLPDRLVVVDVDLSSTDGVGKETCHRVAPF